MLWNKMPHTCCTWQQKFNQDVSEMPLLLDRWTTNQTYLKSRSKLYIYYKRELELGKYVFYLIIRKR